MSLNVKVLMNEASTGEFGAEIKQAVIYLCRDLDDH